MGGANGRRRAVPSIFAASCTCGQRGEAAGVVVPDEHEPTYTNPLLEGQRPVEVGVHNLTEYAGHIFKIYMNSIGPTAKAFAHIPTLLSQGLTSPAGGVTPLAEAKMANQMMQRRIHDFQ